MFCEIFAMVHAEGHFERVVAREEVLQLTRILHDDTQLGRPIRVHRDGLAAYKLIENTERG